MNNFSKGNIRINTYSNDNEKLDMNVVIKDNNIYVKASDYKVQVIDKNIPIDFVDGSYKKIDKTIYEKYSYNLDSIIDKKYKIRYTSLNGFFKSCYIGIKKIISFSILKKILLLRFFCLSYVYCICNNEYWRNA